MTTENEKDIEDEKAPTKKEVDVTADFDFISKGGFLLHCRDGQVLGVTKRQAEKVCSNCHFFDKCLNGEMIESKYRVIHKPDWDIAIARHMIQVLTTQRTTLPSLELYQEFMMQCDLLVLDTRLCNFVNYMDTTLAKEHRFLELAQDGFYQFKLIAKVTSEQWLNLLQLGILLNRDNTNYAVQLHEDEPHWSYEQLASRRNLDCRVSSHRVHAERAIEAILTIQEVLFQGENNPATSSATKLENLVTFDPLCERCTVYFETEEPLPQEHHELIDRLAGGEAYTRTCADGGAFQTEGYTIRSSSPDVLRRALEPLTNNGQESGMVDCSLRVDNPSPDTIGRLINASHDKVGDPKHKGTVGLDIQHNRYFFRKSLVDIHGILQYLTDFSTSAKIRQPFSVHILSSEDQTF